MGAVFWKPAIAILCTLMGVSTGCDDDIEDNTDAAVAPDASWHDGARPGAKPSPMDSAVRASGRRQEGMPCGEAICVSPEDSMGFMDACCLDADTGTCGVSFGGQPCVRPFERDPRCPEITVTGTTLAGCCIDGVCGLEGTPVGIPCIELSEVARRQVEAGVAWPVPRACDAPTGEGDAGTD